ncbi:MAG: sugar phosphate isomerase/epimerase [Candidatus Bipolaricaulis sp.]|nr:sugar phosphate isomerase/epimerase [Candidatus Bipolaricaulis sp.]
MSRFLVGIGAVVSVVGDDASVWERRTELAAGEGPDYLEVWVEHWRGNRFLLEERGPDLRRILSALPVILHAPFLWSSLVTPHPALREYALGEAMATIDLAEFLGAKVVTLHGGVVYAKPLLPEARPDEILAENLDRLVRRARSAGTTLAIENCPGVGGLPPAVVYPKTTADLCAVVARTPGVRATLDIGHALQNNESPVAALRRALPVLENIHLHDMTSQGVAHQELGTGVLDVDDFLQELVDGAYQGHLTLEVSDPSDDKAKILRSFRLVRASLARILGRLEASRRGAGPRARRP